MSLTFWLGDFLRYIFLISGLVLGSFSSAQATNITVNVSMDLLSCAKLLGAQKAPSPLDYAVSDLEGLYLELLDEAKTAFENERQVEVFLKKKAEFLNKLGGLMPLLKNHRTLKFMQVINMLGSLGVSPQSFGLDLSPEGKVMASKSLLNAPPMWMFKPSPHLKNSPIGFTHFKDQPDEELPPHLKRSIGFGTIKVEPYEDPKRLGGQLEFQVKQGQFLVMDHEEKRVHWVNLDLLRMDGFSSEEKNVALIFDPNQREWLVSFELLSSRQRIGF